MAHATDAATNAATSGGPLPWPAFESDPVPPPGALSSVAAGYALLLTAAAMNTVAYVATVTLLAPAEAVEHRLIHVMPALELLGAIVCKLGVYIKVREDARNSMPHRLKFRSLVQFSPRDSSRPIETHDTDPSASPHAQVACLLLIEIGAFPILGGWWLDVCLAPLTGGTTAERWALWALGTPPLHLLAFWLVGLVHMLHVSSLLNQLRELVRWAYVASISVSS